MNFKSITAALLAVLFTSGCASVICKKAESTVATRVADVVAEQLACKNVFAVQKSILETVESVGFCKKQGVEESEFAIQGPIAELVCPTVANFVTSLASTKVPAEWQCSLDPAQVPLRDKVLQACRFIPFQPKPGAK